MKDPYVYEGTSVLINNYNIKDSNLLDKAESDFAIIAIEKLKKSDFSINNQDAYEELKQANRLKKYAEKLKAKKK